MAGRVDAQAQWFPRGDDAHVMPVRCPALDRTQPGGGVAPQHGDKPSCTRLLPDGSRHHCPYLVAVTSVSNTAVRIDLSTIRQKGMSGGLTGARCAVICARQKSNRPPGC